MLFLCRAEWTNQGLSWHSFAPSYLTDRTDVDVWQPFPIIRRKCAIKACSLHPLILSYLSGDRRVHCPAKLSKYACLCLVHLTAPWRAPAQRIVQFLGKNVGQFDLLNGR
jgi:hypothetical protein